MSNGRYWVNCVKLIDQKYTPDHYTHIFAYIYGMTMQPVYIQLGSWCFCQILSIVYILIAVSSSGRVTYNKVNVILIKQPNVIKIYKTITTDSGRDHCS